MAGASGRGSTAGRLRGGPPPAWWTDAKLGIFVHWGLYSIPGFAPTDVEVNDVLSVGGPHPMAHMPYAEWYENSLRFADSPTAAFHRERYGDRPYAEFADDFRASLAHWDPEAWADRFARAGAGYVVMVTKHADGFSLWPTDVPHPTCERWCSERDLVGELAEAVRARGLRFGAYYCGGMDWAFDERPLGRPADVLRTVPHSPEYVAFAEAQVRELVERYRPSVLWNDIAWPVGGDRLRSLLADYYAAVPDGVVNDRFRPRHRWYGLLEAAPLRGLFNRLAASAVDKGVTPAPPPWFDHTTPEFSIPDEVPVDPWETCRGMDRSFGWNRASGPDDFLTRDDLLGSLADIVAKGGNLLLNVGPRGEDAAIPGEQGERLDWLGEWLGAAGPAVRGTRAWECPAATSPEGHALRFTTSGDDVHVLVLDGPTTGALTVEGVAPGPGGEVRLAGGGAVPWSAVGDGSRVELDALDGPTAAVRPLALTIEGAAAAAPA